MKVDDPNSFTKVSYTSKDGKKYDNVDWWNYGRENWCNLEGQYTTIVADLSGLVGAYEMSICSVGIFGTEYTREEWLPEKLNYGDMNTNRIIQLANIEAKPSI